ncbi:hypothetical protein BN873_890024 [Candidatus Competibacter denitrificans Run_A_D11]|uniref:Uncharacterized protein n=1 Tax=Candidatus Competibacter denitrificans Run_A_D11 TaxID=1400863 RepID=W6ME74_9GAMM|nr:hypothetical protein BN873_890024 [Candidatus Competibacter denitrificans Run_A_D11]
MGSASSPAERSALMPTTHGAAPDSRGAKCVRSRVGSSASGAGSIPARTLPIALALVLLTGCAHRIEYRAIPAWLIPPPPVLPMITAAELQCLAPEVYVRLARRDRLRAQEAAELRALLGDENER